MTKKARKVAQATDWEASDVKKARGALWVVMEELSASSASSLPSEAKDYSALIELFTTERCGKASNPVEQKNLLCQAVQEFSTADMRRLCQALAPTVQTIVSEEAYSNKNAVDDDEPQTNDDNVDTEDDGSLTSQSDNTTTVQVLHFLRFTTLLLQAYWQGKHKPRSTPSPTIALLPEFWQVLVPLHDILLSLSECGAAGRLLQTTILQLCEGLWQANVKDRTHVVAQTFALLVQQALEQGTTARRWTRLFEMREALVVMDWEDPDSRWLRSRLLALASSPHCLQHTAGQRFLAAILQLEPDEDTNIMLQTNIRNGTLDEDDEEEDAEDENEAPPVLAALAADLHQAIRVQVPSAKTSLLKAYGEIYWRAWKDTTDQDVKDRLEATVWQDWVVAVLHVEQPATYKAVCTLLQPLHQQAKSVNGGPELLYRLYGPILWRSLRASHAVVRLHAAHCLAAVFPLATPTNILPAVTQACEALHALLQDTDDRVRAAGAQTVGQVLGVFWDTIPAKTIRTLLNTMITQLASDATSAKVRASVLMAVTSLLEYPATHAILRPLLPALGNLFHDRVESVRVAAVRLLLQIKATPGFKYYHIVPVHHLQARLAAESKITGPVAQSLTALMLNSYIPADNRQAVMRAVRFLQDCPTAASTFYANVSAHIPETQVVKLTLLLWKALLTAIHGNSASSLEDMGDNGKRRRTKGRAPKAELDSDDEAVGSDFAGLVSSTDITLWPRIAETVSILWGSIADKLDQSDFSECQEALLDGFSGASLLAALQRLEQGSKDTEEDRYRTTAAILRCCGRLPVEAVDELVQYISKVLENPVANSSAHVALLCLWGKTDEVAPVLAGSLLGHHRGLFRMSESPTTDDLLPQMDSNTALGILTDILRGSDPSSVAARECILQSPSASLSIAKALQKGMQHLEMLLQDGNALADVPGSDISHFLKLFELFGRFCLHAQADLSATTLNSDAQTLLDWTTQVVVPVLVSSPKTAFEDMDISRISLDQSFRTPLSPLASPAPRRRSNRNKTPTGLDGGLGSKSQDPLAQANPVAASRLQKDLAISLLQTACLLFSEWMQVGRPGISVIAPAAKKWAAALGTEQDKLLPPLGRLVLQLVKSGHDPSILEDFLGHCSDAESAQPLQQQFDLLTSKRGITAN
jgi:condensin-2 complex subunit G2